MDNEDYDTKMQELTHDVYPKLNKDPTSTLKTQTSKLITNSTFPDNIKVVLIPKKPSSLRLYGLTKIHKINMLLRPIVSPINSLIYK